MSDDRRQMAGGRGKNSGKEEVRRMQGLDVRCKVLGKRQKGKEVSKMAKKLLGVGMAMALIVGMAGVAGATNPQNITVSVTLTAELSVWVGANTYEFGDLAAEAASISATSIAVKNNSGGLTEKWELSAAVTTGTNPATLVTNWNGGADLTAEQIAMQAMFAATRPEDASFGTATADQTLGAAKVYDDTNNYFLGATGGQAADNTATGAINANSERYLWFRIKLPPSLTNTSQTLSVTINASNL